MIKGSKSIIRVYLFVLLSLMADHGLAQGVELTAAQKRGREIYRKGTSSEGTINATLAGTGTTVPASILTCANCHARDGRGVPEGGVIPSNLTWEALTKPYTVKARTGRKRTTYNPRLLARAISMGIDSSGNTLDSSMPRYELRQQDAADLISYLRILGTDPDPGVTASTIKIAVLLGPPSAYKEQNRLVTALLEAYFDMVNKNGGIYGRQLELIVAELPNKSDERVTYTADFLREQEPFTVISPVLSSAESGLAAAIENSSTPLIGISPLSVPIPRSSFFIRSGTEAQVEALVRFAGNQLKARESGSTLIVHDDTISYRKMIGRHQEAGWASLRGLQLDTDTAAGATVNKLRSLKPDFIVLAGRTTKLNSILVEMQRAAWTPTVLTPATNLSSELLRAPHQLDMRLFLAFPSSPQERGVPATQKFAQFAERNKLEPKQFSMQLDTYVSATLLESALQDIGKDVRRHKLIKHLESIQDLKTGLTPPLTFSPNRRTGSKGAYIFSLDPKTSALKPVTQWIKTE